MRIGVVAYEHWPFGSGIGFVAGEVGRRLGARGHDIVPIAPGFPTIRIRPSVVFRFGGPAILTFWRQAAAAVDREGLDAVWSHNPLFPRDLAVPHVATAHTTFHGIAKHGAYGPALIPYYAMMRRIEGRRLRLQQSAHFTAIDPLVVRELRESGVEGEVVLIANGVDVDRYKPGDKDAARRALGLPEGPIALSLGRLTAAKRPLELLRAWQIHERASGEGHLVLVGGGEMTSAVTAEIRRLGLQRVRHAGFVPPEDKLRFLQAADIFVISSAYEGKPLALLEAMASGLASLVSEIPNLSFVSDASAGIRTDFRYIDAAGAALSSLVRDAKLRAALGTRARSYVLEHADWERIVDAYEAQLRDAGARRA